jgi:hypothetical protein
VTDISTLNVNVNAFFNNVITQGPSGTYDPSLIDPALIDPALIDSSKSNCIKLFRYSTSSDSASPFIGFLTTSASYDSYL